MNYTFLPGAEVEYLEAVRVFEEQRPGLGAALIHDFERIMLLAVERPLAWKLVHSSGIRRIGMRRFPFAVFFRLLPVGSLKSRHSLIIGGGPVTGSSVLGSKSNNRFWAALSCCNWKTNQASGRL